MSIRVLLLADTHLGFDDPVRPRVSRRRRGPDFRGNFERALRPAQSGDVDLVVHGGDLLYRSRVPAGLVAQAFEPLRRVAAGGVPVVVVPGNHERARIPFPLLSRHAGVHVFHVARTFAFEVRGTRVAVGGFPFERRVGGDAFPAHVARTRLLDTEADVRLLCVHQAFEGARVGRHDFRFRHGEDVVPGRAVPRGVAAVLAGHIHRAQVLRRDTSGRPLAAPVVYPGSTERTAFAERDETKGYQRLRFSPSSDGGRLVGERFVELPARPMVVLDVDATGCDGHGLLNLLDRRLRALPRDAVVRLQVRGVAGAETASVLTAASLRRVAPPTMNVDLPRSLPARVTS